ncbi:putative glycosyltransferase EpsD [Lachnospiraceae bacterium]|jgi:glycosyltransferase involved in cell wall biosynthesis|nr:glycosyltransferase family 4 protein [Dorea sp.]GFI36194.1 putative glycosyltransferase EpsD [Lachnospiraceae bacterium]
MKNILILTTTSDFLEKFEKSDVKILKDMGCHIHYAANTKEEQPLFSEKEVTSMGIRIHDLDIERSPYMLRNNVRALRQIIKIVREHDIDLIHCHTPVGGVLGRLAGRYFRKRGLKVIYTAHGFHFYKGAPLLNNTVFYWVERIMAHYTDILVVINQEDYESGCKFRLRKGGKVYYIPGVGLDLMKYAPMSEDKRSQKRKSLGVKENEFFLVSVGELNENKNHVVVLKMLAGLKRSSSGLKVKYGICGDGFFRERMERWIRQAGLEEEVCIYGFTRQVPDIVGCADALIFPSKREGLGMAALEALSMGIPVLASDNRGTREYMEDGKNGFVCKYNDVNGFLKGIRKLQVMQTEEREKMSQACRASVERFAKKYSDKIMREVYRELEKMDVPFYEGVREE